MKKIHANMLMQALLLLLLILLVRIWKKLLTVSIKFSHITHISYTYLGTITLANNKVWKETRHSDTLESCQWLLRGTSISKSSLYVLMCILLVRSIYFGRKDKTCVPNDALYTMHMYAMHYVFNHVSILEGFLSLNFGVW